MEKLQLGIAYHGNRILKHVKTDMEDFVNHNMNLVVHMFTHNDMKRHKEVMKDIFAVTRDYGLDFWVDNWGLAGTPGDSSHFLSYYPDSHRYFSDGKVDPLNVCFASEHFVKFTKEWIDMVGEAGGKKIIWDEPHYFTYDTGVYACCCPRCKKRFYETYGHEMPALITPEVEEFRVAVLSDYFKEVTEYAHKNGMENIVCLMPNSNEFINSVIKLPYMDNIGIDPYWFEFKEEAYPYVYNFTKKYTELTKENNKDNHLWIQTYNVPAGREDEIFLAAEAAYDAGARTILAWSHRGGEACDYRAANTDLTWKVTGEAMRRLKDRFIDEQRDAWRKKVQK